MEEKTDAGVFQTMWEEGGADEENPMPYLKTTICRVISIAAIVRSLKENGKVALYLMALLHDYADPKHYSEAEILSCFLKAFGEIKPQLVVQNLARTDLKILVQCAFAKGLQEAKSIKRLDNP